MSVSGNNIGTSVKALLESLSETQKEVVWDGGELRQPIDTTVSEFKARLEEGVDLEEALVQALDATAPNHTAWRLAERSFTLMLVGLTPAQSLANLARTAANRAKRAASSKRTDKGNGK